MNGQLHPKNSGKVFDVARPNRSTPSATSRPIVVGNRPEQPDPMVVVNAETTEADAPSLPTAEISEPTTSEPTAAEQPSQPTEDLPNPPEPEQAESRGTASAPSDSSEIPEQPAKAHNPEDIVTMPTSSQKPAKRSKLITAVIVVLIILAVVVFFLLRS